MATYVQMNDHILSMENQTKKKQQQVQEYFKDAGM